MNILCQSKDPSIKTKIISFKQEFYDKHFAKSVCMKTSISQGAQSWLTFPEGHQDTGVGVPRQQWWSHAPQSPAQAPVRSNQPGLTALDLLPTDPYPLEHRECNFFCEKKTPFSVQTQAVANL